jgi:hypothetical protein
MQNQEKFSYHIFNTLWCGTGNRSKDNNELGPASKTDACCREHDKCPINVDISERKKNSDRKYYTRRV